MYHPRNMLLSVTWAFFNVIALTTAIHGNTIENSKWERDLTSENLIYNDGVVFTKQTSGAISCAQICQLHNMTCVAFTYTIPAKECRGYDGLSQHPVTHASTKMWKLFPGVCRLDGYTYDPIFGVCIHLYTTALIWDKAVEACSNDSAYLLILDTMEKVQATKTGVHKERFEESHHWWLGGYDYDDGPANDFRWSNDASIDVNSNLWFTSSQPDNQHERCINLNLSPVGINDLMCTAQLFYVCQEEI